MARDEHASMTIARLREALRECLKRCARCRGRGYVEVPAFIEGPASGPLITPQSGWTREACACCAPARKALEE